MADLRRGSAPACPCPSARSMSQIAWEAHVSGGVWPANPIEQAWYSNHGVCKKWGRAARGRRDINFLEVILEVRETRCRKLRNCLPAIRASLIRVLLSTFTSQLSAHRCTYEHAAAWMGSRAAGPLLVRAEEREVGDSKGTTAKHCITSCGRSALEVETWTTSVGEKIFWPSQRRKGE
jgi:hypothetical protein